VVLGSLVYRSLVWCGAVGYVTGLCDTARLALSASRSHNPQLHTRPTTCKPKSQVPQAAAICITLEFLMMGMMVPKHVEQTIGFTVKNQFVASSWPFISTNRI
jgi:hypothetical protein